MGAQRSGSKHAKWLKCWFVVLKSNKAWNAVSYICRLLHLLKKATPKIIHATKEILNSPIN